MNEFSFAGQPIPFLDGQTVGAALLAAGVRTLRTTRGDERPRGLLCGIGICFDCLVVVEGEPNQRACLLLARPDLRVDPQEGTGHAWL